MLHSKFYFNNSRAYNLNHYLQRFLFVLKKWEYA